ncbi:MAG: hypothetical protein EOM20_14470 [Spartobacteria bacterium]|nr:hypothetical protein [Spartobacteria bacterium]
MGFDLERLLKDVFEPVAGDHVLVMIDEPHDQVADTPEWRDRRQMALEWRAGFMAIGIAVHPLVAYAATGANNGDIPVHGVMEGRSVCIAEMLEASTIVVAMTQYSASAPLAMAAKKSNGQLRVASMPGVTRGMEQTALSEDHRALARRVHVLTDELTRAVAADITFSTGHRLHLDLRYRTGHGDNGHCPPGTAKPLINLPSGEAYIVPYEGEREGEPSLSAGEIPMVSNGEQVVLAIARNRIVAVTGDGAEAARLGAFFQEDPARANIAELGLGCNSRAVVTGHVIEDEKAGLHWAYGRSEHLGGTVGPSAFTAPQNVIHSDVVYARGCPIETTELSVTGPDGRARILLENSEYILDFN